MGNRAAREQAVPRRPPNDAHRAARPRVHGEAPPARLVRADLRRLQGHDTGLNVRALIERGVRETGSFEKAMSSFTHKREVESDVEYFEAEAARFAKDFTRQARQNAGRILTGSHAAIKGVFDSYGIRGDAAWYHAMEVRKGSPVETEAEAMVKVAGKEAVLKGKRDDPYAERRGNLRNEVKALRARQKTIS